MVSTSSSTDDFDLPMKTILHLITIKLSSINYLLWTNQVTPILTYQGLLGHIDGSPSLLAEFSDAEKSTPDPAYYE